MTRKNKKTSKLAYTRYEQANIKFSLFLSSKGEQALRRGMKTTSPLAPEKGRGPLGAFRPPKGGEDAISSKAKG